VVHDPKQLEPPGWQRYAPHELCCLTHAGPLGSPEQTWATSVEPLQLTGPHGVLAGDTLHPRLPSQAPSLPHGFDGSVGQLLPAAGAVPAGAGRHLPSAPASAQRSHAFVHALEQHTPSTQLPEAHS
jgi:hypothetical protein